MSICKILQLEETFEQNQIAGQWQTLLMGTRWKRSDNRFELDGYILSKRAFQIHFPRIPHNQSTNSCSSACCAKPRFYFCRNGRRLAKQSMKHSVGSAKAQCPVASQAWRRSENSKVDSFRLAQLRCHDSIAGSLAS